MCDDSGMRVLLLPLARIWALAHCLFKHGAAPFDVVDNDGLKSVLCNVCGQVFWRRRVRRFHRIPAGPNS
jgi:hypothetical protein